MYKIKNDVIQKYKKYGTIRKISQETELSENYISQIFLGKRNVHKKVYAYAITKAISMNLEIQDIFEIV